MFYTAELQNGAGLRKAEPCKATRLDAAKAVATRRQTFQGTTLVVYDAAGYRIAINHGDGWFSYPDEAPLNCAPDFDPSEAADDA